MWQTLIFHADKGEEEDHMKTTGAIVSDVDEIDPSETLETDELPVPPLVRGNQVAVIDAMAELWCMKQKDKY